LQTITILAQFKIAIETRKEIARELAKLEATQRATAKVLGVGEGTVNRDIHDAPNGAKPKNKPIQHKELKNDNPPNGTSRPSPLDLGGDEAAQIAEKQVTKAYDKAHQYGHDQGDEWYTPKWIFDSLGLQFAIDVCAPQ